MSLDVSTIRELLSFEDADGVLSLYAEHTPSQASSSPKAPLEIRNRTKDLLATLEPSLADKVRRRLDEAAAEVEWLVAPGTTGRGRALFLGVADGRVERVTVQVPLRARVIHHAHPFVRPLVAAVDEGRPALVVLADAKSVQVLRWSVGELEHVDTREFELGDAQLADQHRGPSGKPDQRGVNHAQQFEDRVDANRARFLRSVADDVRGLREQLSFDRMMVAGPAKVRRELCDALAGENSLEVLETDQVLGDVGDTRLKQACWDVLRSSHRERERALLRTAVDRAGAGGAGVVGLAGTLSALNEGRVQHLLFADDLAVPGFVDDDGLLWTTPGPEHDRRPTPLLVEHMVERALTTSARVTPVDDDVADGLRQDGGVAALLRW